MYQLCIFVMWDQGGLFPFVWPVSILWVFTLCRGRLSCAWGRKEHISVVRVSVVHFCDVGSGWLVSVWSACFYFVGVHLV